MGKTAALLILLLLRNRLKDEEQQHKAHLDDSELRGRFLATKGILEDIYLILEKR